MSCGAKPRRIFSSGRTLPSLSRFDEIQGYVPNSPAGRVWLRIVFSASPYQCSLGRVAPKLRLSTLPDLLAGPGIFCPQEEGFPATNGVFFLAGKHFIWLREQSFLARKQLFLPRKQFFLAGKQLFLTRKQFSWLRKQFFLARKQSIWPGKQFFLARKQSIRLGKQFFLARKQSIWLGNNYFSRETIHLAEKQFFLARNNSIWCSDLF
jgi:hypothetical protein